MKTKVVLMGLLATAFLVGCGGSSNNGSDNANSSASSDVDVKGTYVKTFSTEEISGNVRHTGYLSALGATETNTIVLGDNNTYTYTKFVSTDGATAQSRIRRNADAEVAILFSWESAGDGKCSLDFFVDGTYEFQYSDYNVSEKGTWTCASFKMTVTTPKGQVFNPEMDDDHAFAFTYVADAGGGALSHPFKVASSVWGAAIGQTGTYEIPEDDPNLFSWESAGDGKCTLDFLKDGSYEFQYTDYGLSEKGTWTWSGFKMTVATPKGQVFNPEMDAEYTLSFTYVADAGGGALSHPFKVASSVWGAALGSSGSYTPENSSSEEQLTCTNYYKGSGQKESNGVTFDVTYELFFLSNNTLILQVESGGSKQYQVGTYEGDHILPWSVLNTKQYSRSYYDEEEYDDEDDETAVAADSTLRPSTSPFRIVSWRDALSSVTFGASINMYHGNAWQHMNTDYSYNLNLTYKYLYAGVSFAPCNEILFVHFQHEYEPFMGVMGSIHQWKVGGRLGISLPFQQGMEVWNFTPYVAASLMRIRQHGEPMIGYHKPDIHRKYLVGPGLSIQVAVGGRYVWAVNYEYQLFVGKLTPRGMHSLGTSIGFMF